MGIRRKKSSLLFILDYILMFDDLQGKRISISLPSRRKPIFYWKKLGLVFNDKYYSVSQIFELNSIEYRSDASFEIAKLLEKKNI